MDSNNWRGGGGSGGSGGGSAGPPPPPMAAAVASPALKGELQQADQVGGLARCVVRKNGEREAAFHTNAVQSNPPQRLREQFTLFLYVPTDQVGVVIGKKVGSRGAGLGWIWWWWYANAKH